MVGLLFGALTPTAGAQHRRGHRSTRVFIVPRPFFPYFHHTYFYPNAVYDPIAYQREQGYSDGLSRGKHDVKHGKPNAPQSHKHYRNSDSLTYREAFLQGYADGYFQHG
jgi:hypothetical protein